VCDPRKDRPKRRKKVVAMKHCVFVVLASAASLVLVGTIVAACGSTSSSSSGTSTNEQIVGKPSSTNTKQEGDIQLIKRKSFCTTTGVADVYTGEGKVQFWLTFRNTATSDKSVSFTPVRHYDDGEVNDSAMDEASTPDVAPGQTWKGKTQAFTYKAHEHEVAGCAGANWRHRLSDPRRIPQRRLARYSS
jgi:hypothetical protein